MQNFIHANLLRYKYCRYVHGAGECGAQAYFAVPFKVRVLRSPALRKFGFLIFNYAGRGKAVIHGGKVNKRLKAGTRLAYCHNCAVEFVFGAAANHGFNVAGGRV